jgi:hypothetical protein
MICGSPQSHFPPCQAADDVADLHVAVVAAAAADVVVVDVDVVVVVVAGLDTVQNFAPTPAFLQLSARPAIIMAVYIK